MSTYNIPFSILKIKIILYYTKSVTIEYFFKGLKKEFKRAVVNEPSVFEPLKFYCIKEWTIMDLASSTRATENMTRWKGIDAKSSLVPRRPSKVMG